MQACDFESITVAGTAIGFTSTKLTPDSRAPIRAAFVTVELGSVRFRVDGTAPTATVGHVVEAGDTILINEVSDVKNARFIQDGASFGELSVTYMR